MTKELQFSFLAGELFLMARLASDRHRGVEGAGWALRDTLLICPLPLMDKSLFVSCLNILELNEFYILTLNLDPHLDVQQAKYSFYF